MMGTEGCLPWLLVLVVLSPLALVVWAIFAVIRVAGCSINAAKQKREKPE